MDSKLILEAARGTLDGSLSFPEVVGKLLAAAVEYYHVDFQTESGNFRLPKPATGLMPK